MSENGPNHIQTYSQFWPYYLREHSGARTRAIHYLGTCAASFALLLFLLTWDFWFVAVSLAAGYGPAWFAHFFVEKNRPATFSYPLWSLASDFRMTFRWLTGRLGSDLARAGIRKS